MGGEYSLVALRLRCATLRTSGVRGPFVLSVPRRVKSKHERRYPPMNEETYMQHVLPVDFSKFPDGFHSEMR
jgi:hypothetical protein